MEINKRHDELSEKLFNIGNTLIKEGTNKEDYTITSVGNFMILVSGIIFEERDVQLFSDLCAMFSAKKVIDSQYGDASTESLNDLNNQMTDDIYDAYKDMRNDLTNLDDTEDDDDDDVD